MENHLDQPEAVEAPPEPRPKPSARELVLGSVVVAAILTFDVNPAGPVLVVVAAIAAGSFSFRRVGDVALKAAAVGLVVGGIVAILFWPFFDVG